MWGMRRLVAALAIALAPALASQIPTPDPTPAPSAAARVAMDFAPFDHDGDGRVEVRSLEVLADRAREGGPLVLVLVESRLVPPAPLRSASPLLQALAVHGEDLARDRFSSLLVSIDVHAGPPHQDGRTVLALQTLLARLHATGSFAGALLVGHFPDALLVRTCNWRRNESLQLPDRDGRLVPVAPATTNVRCVPEVVAHRCDVVLADLDGRWHEVYVPGPTELPSVTVVFGDSVPDEGGAALLLRTEAIAAVDVFHVRDGLAAVDRETFSVRLDANDRDHECGDRDRARKNPMAVPDVAVSRIDARGVAFVPDARPDAHDAAGRPRAFAHDGGANPWRHDLALEQQLLCEYFARNHAFRSQPLAAKADRPAAFGHGLGSGFDSLLPARAEWATAVDRSLDRGEGDLLALLQWMQQAAVLRTLRVHSDPFCGVVGATDANALQRALGTPSWWPRDGDRLVPGWADHRGGRADFAFYRTLWQRQCASDQPFVLVHTGCEAMSPPGAVALAYDDAVYGRFAHAESILFFTPCVAMVGRAKVFYDEPRGFARSLGEGATVGEAWRRSFELESEAKTFAEVGDDIGRKRACFWSLVGDFTLRLPRP